jgi:hypothetical protein
MKFPRKTVAFIAALGSAAALMMGPFHSETMEDPTRIESYGESPISFIEEGARQVTAHRLDGRSMNHPLLQGPEYK